MITLPVYDKNRGILMPPDAHPANTLDQGIVWLGRTVSWCVPVMALLVLVIVVLRYGFNTGAIAAQKPCSTYTPPFLCWALRWHCRLTNTFALISSIGASQRGSKRGSTGWVMLSSPCHCAV